MENNNSIDIEKAFQKKNVHVHPLNFIQVIKESGFTPPICWMIELLETDKITIEKKIKGGLLEGKSFCFTGKLNNITRNEAKDLVVSLGGQFKSGITKTLSFLVTNNPSSGSSKNIKARDLGVDIITEQEFLEMTQ